MRLYLDSSALIKLYVEEDGSTLVERAVDEAGATATSIVAYVEARAAFSRRRRDGSLSIADYNRVLKEFDGDWLRYFVVEVNEALIRSAGQIAEVRSLRAYDAIHLASADFFQAKIREPVTFGCWDSRLEAAARRQGLHLLRTQV